MTVVLPNSKPEVPNLYSVHSQILVLQEIGAQDGESRIARLMAYWGTKSLKTEITGRSIVEGKGRNSEKEWKDEMCLAVRRAVLTPILS